MKQLALASMLAFGGAAAASAGGFHVNVNIGAPYYGYAPAQVVYVERYVPVYDVPRVLYVSRFAGVPPHVIVGHYRGGWGWNRIHSRYRVPAHAFYRGGYAPAFRHGKIHSRHSRGHHYDRRGRGRRR